MVSTTTFGNFPGVKVTTAGGAVTGIAVGREQNVVLVGTGSGGTAPTNEPVQIQSRLGADRTFGEGSALARGMKDALGNGASIEFLYGVQVEVDSITGETVSGSDAGTLAEAPIIEDTEQITVTDNTASEEMTVEFVYDDDLSTSPDSGIVNVNPITGDFLADSASDYEFEYESPDYESGFTATEEVFGTDDSGIIAVLSESEEVATELSQHVNSLRENYEMALGLQAGEPTGTGPNGNAYVDPDSYTDSIDNDAMFLHVPGRLEASNLLVTGGLAGLMAGTALNDSIYQTSLSVDNLEQRLSKSDISSESLRSADVVPIRQPSQGGSITVVDNQSTSTEDDYVRDYFTRRIVDQVALIAKTIGDSVIGRINDQSTRDTVRNQLRSELRGLAQDRLIKSNIGTDEDNWFVDVYEIDPNTVGIDLGVTPLGIVKRIDVTVTIDT